MSASQTPKVAIVRLDALGDTLLSTPAIDFLREELGAENLLVFVSPGLGEIFGEVVPSIEISPELSEQAIADHIDAFGADIVFVFSEKKRALRAAHLSKAAQKIGFDPGWSQPIRSLEVKRFLTLRFPIVNSLNSNSRYHEVERYCRLVSRGLSRKFLNGAGLRLFALGERPRRQPGLTQLGFQWTKKWLHGGWSEETLRKVLQSLPQETKVFVAPNEKSWAEESLPETRQNALVCTEGLRDYALEVARCRYLVTIDTGAVHIASAVGTPVIDVFPESQAQHTVPRWRPWMVPHQVVLKTSNSSIPEFLERLTKARLTMEEVLRWSDRVSTVEGLPSSQH